MVLKRRIWQSRASLVGQDFLLFCAVMFDSGVMVLGEVRNQSISGPEGFILFPLNFSEITHPVAQIETEVPWCHTSLSTVPSSVLMHLMVLIWTQILVRGGPLISLVTWSRYVKIDTHSITDDHWQEYYKPGTCKLNLEPDYKSRRMMVFSVKF